MKQRLNYPQIIALGFICIIILGTILLCLPISVKEGVSVTPMQALFVATSATCVTGLTVVDTYSTWSLFGQTVIMLLIQIGGLGFMTIITMMFIFMKRKISLHERKLLMQSAGTMRISGVVRLIRRIAAGTLIFESLGAVMIAISLYPQLGIGKSIYYGIFHSISAFCNAGFDLFGFAGRFSSLISVSDNVLLNITVMLLIVTGGLGFIVWEDMYRYRFEFGKYSLHSKILLSFTLILLFGGAALFFAVEYNSAFSHLPTGQKIMAAFFQAITPRTAGFCTVDQASLSQSGRLLTVLLMFIGGGSGSTAGGIKVTTFAVLILSMLSAARGKQSVTLFRKRLGDDSLKQASSIFLIYGFMVIVSFFIMSMAEKVSGWSLIFEIVSAVCTVGSTLGITPTLTTMSKIVLMILMFCGRIGGLTFMLLIAEKKSDTTAERPTEKIIIG